MKAIIKYLYVVMIAACAAAACMGQSSTNNYKINLNHQDSTLLGTWISEEDNNWKLEFKNDTCLSTYIGSSTDTYKYTISNTSPQCGEVVDIDQYSNYLQLTNVSDTTDKICYLINGVTDTALSLSPINRGGAFVFTKQ